MEKFEELLKNKFGDCYMIQSTKCYGRRGREGDYFYNSTVYSPFEPEKLNEKLQKYLPNAHPKLIEFWQKYNGVKLCSLCLTIYGFSTPSYERYSPYNIGTSSFDFQTFFEKYGIDASNLQNIGEYFYYSLCYNIKEQGKFYLINLKELKPVQVFDTIEEFLALYVERELSVCNERGSRDSDATYDLVIRPKDIEFQKQFPSIETLANK